MQTSAEFEAVDHTPSMSEPAPLASPSPRALSPDPLVLYRVTTNNVAQRQAASELAGALPSPHNATVTHGTHGVRCRAPSQAVHKLSELTLPERVYAIICDVPAAELPDDDQLIPQLRALLLASEQWPMALEAHRRVHPAAAHGHSGDRRHCRGRVCVQAKMHVGMG